MRRTSVIQTYNRTLGIGIVRGSRGRMSLLLVNKQVDPKKLIPGSAIYTINSGHKSVTR